MMSISITNILVSTFFVFSAAFGAQICNSPGECVNSVYLGSTPANGTIDCLNTCRVHEGCNFATYSPDYEPNECLLFQTCEELDTSFCPNCLTSGTDCAQCDVTGICIVRTWGVLDYHNDSVQKYLMVIKYYVNRGLYYSTVYYDCSLINVIFTILGIPLF